LRQRRRNRNRSASGFPGRRPVRSGTGISCGLEKGKGLDEGAECKVGRSSKSQVPSSRETSSTKLQMLHQAQHSFWVWNLELLWSLGFGAWVRWILELGIWSFQTLR